MVVSDAYGCSWLAWIHGISSLAPPAFPWFDNAPQPLQIHGNLYSIVGEAGE